jgi:hypothetical protein
MWSLLSHILCEESKNITPYFANDKNLQYLVCKFAKETSGSILITVTSGFSAMQKKFQSKLKINPPIWQIIDQSPLWSINWNDSRYRKAYLSLLTSLSRVYVDFTLWWLYYNYHFYDYILWHFLNFTHTCSQQQLIDCFIKKKIPYALMA